MIFGFRKIGRWDKVVELTKSLAPTLHKATLAGQKAVAEKLAEIVKGHLLNQDLTWTPLSESYKKHKQENKDMILVARWKYYDAIRIEKRGDSYSIGVRKDRYYVNAGKTRIALYKVAAFHEGNPQVTNLFGRGITLPVRPLWTPSVQELTAQGVDKLIVKYIRQHLKAKGWGNVTLKELRKYKAPI